MSQSWPCLSKKVTNIYFARKNNGKIEETKAPMTVLNMNGQSKREEDLSKMIKKQAPVNTQEENIRRALRDYYAKK